MESGLDLAGLRPLNLDPQSRIRGNHKGNAYSLNVVDPKPGTHYVYVRREEGEVQRFLNEGWVISRRDTGDRARMGRETDQQWGQPTDGTIGRRDVIRMEIDDEGYAAYMERKAHVRTVQSAERRVEEYLDSGAGLTSATHSNRPLYYRGPDHKTERYVEAHRVSEE